VGPRRPFVFPGVEEETRGEGEGGRDGGRAEVRAYVEQQGRNRRARRRREAKAMEARMEAGLRRAGEQRGHKAREAYMEERRSTRKRGGAQRERRWRVTEAGREISRIFGTQDVPPLMCDPTAKTRRATRWREREELSRGRDSDANASR
jgi:hypothetical protein